jgi:hypothetical protein
MRASRRLAPDPVISVVKSRRDRFGGRMFCGTKILKVQILDKSE